MNWIYNDKAPERFTKEIKLGQRIVTFNVFITKEENKYKWLSFTLPPETFSYESAVSLIMNTKYPDLQETIIQHTIDSKDEVFNNKFIEIQKFKQKVIDEVTDLLTYVDENKLWDD